MNGKTRFRILLVDDDARLRELLSRYLLEQGFAVKAVGDASMMDRALHREHFDLMVLDLMLPGEDGLAICRRLRAADNALPIIMLTAKGDDVDRIIGLEMGADDYVAKPFNPRELVARIQAVMRRQPQTLPGAPAAENQIPVIMLTAKGDDVDRIVGLEMGADDYIAKPFNPRELVARIQAVMRRQPQTLPGAPTAETAAATARRSA